MATKGTLKYRKVTRTPQSGPNKNKQMYYATAVTDREMNFEEFVTHISEPLLSRLEIIGPEKARI